MEPGEILVVDDDPHVLKLFVRVLRASGYIVHEGRSGADAIRLLQEEQIDLMVLDLSMPEPDGFEVLTAIHAIRPELKILAVSGLIPADALLKAAHLMGATATLNKAEAATKLLGVVESLVKPS